MLRATRLVWGGAVDVCLWRNNTGVIPDARGVPIRYGLAVGSADLVGIYRGRFVAIECKAPGGAGSRAGSLTPEQVQWLRLVARMGGFVAVVRSEADARAALAALVAGADSWGMP